MDNEYIENLRKQVKKALEDDHMRYMHTLGVANTCACLAMTYGQDIQAAYIAGILHDCAKCVPDDKKIAQCKEYGIEINESELKAPYLLHAKLGAYYAKHIYNVNNDEICRAIEYHTTGKPEMNLLEKILFVSDYIEPYRNKAPNLQYIRQISFQNIDKAIYEITKDTLNHLKEHEKYIDETTMKTFNYYKNIIAQE